MLFDVHLQGHQWHLWVGGQMHDCRLPCMSIIVLKAKPLGKRLHGHAADFA